jgi:hypothetical protein
MPFSGSPFACVHGVLNVPIFKLGGENLPAVFAVVVLPCQLWH